MRGVGVAVTGLVVVAVNAAAYLAWIVAGCVHSLPDGPHPTVRRQTCGAGGSALVALPPALFLLSVTLTLALVIVLWRRSAALAIGVGLVALLVLPSVGFITLLLLPS